jgi:pilus assembly protein CpaF
MPVFNLTRELPTAAPTPAAFQTLTQKIHGRMVSSLDLAAVQRLDDEQVRAELDQLAWEYIDAEALGLSDAQRGALHKQLQHEIFGLGPLETLLADPQVSDVLVNGPEEVYIERQGKLKLTEVVFASEEHLMRIIQRAVSMVGRRIDETSPVVDARLEDGSRINAIIPPLALGGAKLSIRRFVASSLHLGNLISNGSLSVGMGEFLSAAVASRMNIIISGGTGAGKTTLLDALSAYIDPSERIVTVEDSAELVLQHPHVVRLETRPANNEGQGEFTQRDLVRNSLRMRPDRIIVGEVRGGEALDMLQAMNTGHDGSLSTVHANDTNDALARLELMISMAGFDLPVRIVRQYIASGIDLVVHVARLKGGVRRILRITEVLPLVDDEFQLSDIFRCKLAGIDDEGVTQSSFAPTGVVPECRNRFEQTGISFDDAWFKPRTANSPDVKSTSAENLRVTNSDITLGGNES